jgi:hypothetical protein
MHGLHASPAWNGAAGVVEEEANPPLARLGQLVCRYHPFPDSGDMRAGETAAADKVCMTGREMAPWSQN